MSFTAGAFDTSAGYEYVKDGLYFQMVPLNGSREMGLSNPFDEDALFFCTEPIQNVIVDTIARRGDTLFPSWILPRQKTTQFTFTGALPSIMRWDMQGSGETGILMLAVLAPANLKCTVCKVEKDRRHTLIYSDEVLTGLLREVKYYFIHNMNITLSFEPEFQKLVFPEDDLGDTILIDKVGDKVTSGIKPTSADKVLIYGWDIDDSRDGIVAAGRAEIGGRYAWMDANSDLRVTAHEICHTLGLDHDLGSKANLMNNQRQGNELHFYQIIAANAGAIAFDALTA